MMDNKDKDYTLDQTVDIKALFEKVKKENKYMKAVHVQNPLIEKNRKLLKELGYYDSKPCKKKFTISFEISFDD